jgi:hypothetical protein
LNIYVTVEGKGEKIVYKKWIKFTNSSLRIVDSIDEVTQNRVFIISGGGYPHYFETIEYGVRDVEGLGLFDLLVISIDSEDMSFNEKYEEVKNFIDNLHTNINYKIIVQNFCLETWALGNRNIIPRNPQSTIIRNYINYYNVLLNDPENLPPYPEEELNRAQFAQKYLRTILNDRYRNLTYLKSNPEVLTDKKFFKRIKSRCLDTNHISSFNGFLEAFN